jgi:tRNA pseudouridine55 synthase
MAATARRFFPCVDVDEDGVRAVGFGRSLDLRLPALGPVAVLGPTGEFLALYEHRTDETDGPARPVAVFV